MGGGRSVDRKESESVKRKVNIEKAMVRRREERKRVGKEKKHKRRGKKKEERKKKRDRDT